MKTFKTLEQAKKDLLELQYYVRLIEEYQPKNFTQEVIKIYAIHGSIAKTTATLSNQGHLIEQKEVSNIIKSTPANDDFLHKKIKSLYLKKTRSTRRTTSSIQKYY
ncbi:hypothetical protein MKY29_14355 [Psychrobacillus sp. FSL K6-2365]|uniref:hypothetical protein n=1 Tax=Psychrobacillus sp. FSL K6-2365 TaxID=2921546 RepID=UPI0030F9D0B6